jgi:hypothetical protein
VRHESRGWRVIFLQMDGTGVPVVKKDTVGRQGKTGGQPAHTREAKLGCVFTQTTWDQTKGYAIRDADSTTYVGAIETAEESGKRIYPEAWNRGWSRAEKKVVMATGPNGSAHPCGRGYCTAQLHRRTRGMAARRCQHPCAVHAGRESSRASKPARNRHHPSRSTTSEAR